MTAGHRSLPHTADVIVEAWADTRERCLGEAVAALVDSVADTGGAPSTSEHRFHLAPAPDADLLLGVLDEAIYLIDIAEAVPVRTYVEPDGGGLTVVFGLAELDATEQTGSAPKGVSLSGLQLTRADGQWRARAVVDV